MTKVCISTIIVLMAMNIGLFAQDDPSGADTLLKQAGELSLELLWEKELPEGTGECVLLDESGMNIFSSQCAKPAKALQKMRALIVANDAIKLIKTDDFTVEREIKISQYSKVSVSKNGKNFAVIEHVISGDIESRQWYRNVEKSILRLFNSALEELAQITLGPSPYANIFAVGNDKTVVITDAGEDGRYTNITVFVKQDNTFRVSFALIGGLYPTFLFDYAENGSRIFLIHNDKPVDGSSNLGERIVLDGEGREIVRYTYQHQGWKGWLSPIGNYIVEVTRGKYLVIRNKNGKLIADYQVQGQGNYYTSFSSNERYLCVTPGPWRIYHLQTKDGKMLWDYAHPDSFILFLNVESSNDGVVYVYSQPWSYPQPDRKIDPSPLLPEKSLHIFNIEGEHLDLLRPVEKIYSIQTTSDNRFLLVHFFSKLHLYDVIGRGD